MGFFFRQLFQFLLELLVVGKFRHLAAKRVVLLLKTVPVRGDGLDLPAKIFESRCAALDGTYRLGVRLGGEAV